MSKATFTFGRFNPPTEIGHGKLVSAVQTHAEKTGSRHYIFPSHSQDKKKNPLVHGDKVGAMTRMFPNANIISHGKVRTAIDAMKHLEKQGHTHVTMVVGSDRVADFHSLLNKYRKKEYPGIKKVDVISAGHRDPDAEGAEGMSASKLRELVAAGKKKEFVSHYSDPKLGAHIHDKVKAGMQMESVSPVGIFLLGGPGSGKDYVLKNIFSRFDLTEVQADQILNGAASDLYESNRNIVINGANDADKIEMIQHILEGYTFDFVHVSVTNKVSRLRNEQREQPLIENKRIEKFLKAEELAKDVEAFIFNNSINLNESSEMERVFFGAQIEKLLERVVELGLEIKTSPEPKTFTVIKEKYFPPVAKHKSGLPKKYVGKLSDSTASARKAHWKKMGKLSDSDPRAYEPAPGDASSKTKPSKHTIAVRKMMGEQIEGDLKVPHTVDSIAAKHKVSVASIIEALKQGVQVEMEHTKDEKTAKIIALGHLWERPDYYTMLAKMEAVEVLPSKLRRAPRSGNITQVMDKRRETGRVSESADSSLAAKAEKSGVSVSTLRKVYKRGVAAWNSGHRPGTTPQQWGHARVNSYINKGKTYHTADKDLREETENLDELFEMQLAGTDEYRKHAIAMTPGQEIQNAFDALGKPKKNIKKESAGEDCECGGDCGCSEIEPVREGSESAPRSFDSIRTKTKETKETKEAKEVDITPSLATKKKKGPLAAPRNYDSTLHGLPVTSRFNAYEEKEPKKDFMPTPKQVTRVLPPGTKVADGVPQHDVPKGWKRVRDFGAGYKLVKEEDEPSLSLEEAVQYHLENKISFTENVFRPGSDMFFEMINEAKRLYAEDKYEPKDEWEKDMLESNIGEKAMFEGQEVILDYPFEEMVNEADDPTNGKGIGKPWQEGGGGAVYVKVGDSVRKISFSKSGMKKKYMDPAATRSFVARHRCLTNKDKTSSSYWACRWPRFFSNSGKVWW
jgi:dephospho-CoA kinase